MGMDLIGAGFTVDTRREPVNLSAVLAYIEGMEEPDPNEPISWDPAGLIMSDDDDWRAMLRTGVEEYVAVNNASRLVVDFPVGETGNTFVFTGGGSWGDDPFDGFTPLLLFINLLDEDAALRALTNYVGGGVVVEQPEGSHV